MAKPALGRGLGALLGGAPVAKTSPATSVPSPAVAGTPAPSPRVPGEHVERVNLARIRPSPFQPRKDFSAEGLRELSDSIREQGIVQPLIVRERNGHLELIAGERRWRAAQLAGLEEVPVILRQADDRAVLELALIENLQRENLNPLEEAQGYAELISHFQLTQEQVAVKVGRSRAVVANALRLLKLPGPLRDYLREGKLSVGHAKVLLGLTNEPRQRQAAEAILKEGLNVRQTEALVGKWQGNKVDSGSPTPSKTPPARDTHVVNLETKLRERLGTKVHLRYAHGKGALEITFFSDEDLERILQMLKISSD